MQTYIRTKPHELHIQGLPLDCQEKNIAKQHRKRKAKTKKAKKPRAFFFTFSLQKLHT